MALTFAVLLLGSASGSPRIGVPLLLGLLGVGIAWHVFVYVTNDLMDLHIDRTDPRRAASPLVRGTVRPWQALTVALAQLPVAVLFTARLGGAAPAVAALGASFSLLAVYNLWGKRAPFPPLTDVLQGLGWGALALYGAAVSGRWTWLTGVVVCFVVVLITLANGVHGGLRDLANDRRHGVRSTALLMGARPTLSGGLHVPRRIRTYAFTLQGVLSGIVLVPLAHNQLGYPPAVWLPMFVLVLALSAAALWLLAVAASIGDTQALRLVGTLQLTITLALPIALVAPSLDGALAAVLVGGYVAPLLSFSWLPPALRWGWDAGGAAAGRLLRRAGTLLLDLAWLVRLPNCLAAAAATLLGAYLSEGTPALGNSLVVRASLVAFLVHAASNVFNDLMDLRIDRLNRPARPLPSGRVSPAAAAALASATGTAGLGLAIGLGPVLAGLAAALAVVALGYSYRLKNSILLGNATVALLAASTIAYGALAAGALNRAVAVASGLTFLYMLAFEVLKSIEDREGDAAAGLRTVASLGLGSSLQVFRLVAAVFTISAVAPWLMGFASGRYLLAILGGAIVPMLVVAALLGRSATAQAIHLSWGVTKVAWPLGLLAMALLR